MSRFGQILYSSSNDVNGPIANSVEDAFRVFRCIHGQDVNDSNCINFGSLKVARDYDKSRVLDDRMIDNEANKNLGPLGNMTVGIIKELLTDEETERSRSVQ